MGLLIDFSDNNEIDYPAFIDYRLREFLESFEDLHVKIVESAGWQGSFFGMGHGKDVVNICKRQAEQMAQQLSIPFEDSFTSILLHEVGHYLDMKKRKNTYKIRNEIDSYSWMEENRELVMDCELGANFEAIGLAKKFGYSLSYSLIRWGIQSQGAQEKHIDLLYEMYYMDLTYSAFDYELGPRLKSHAIDMGLISDTLTVNEGQGLEKTTPWIVTVTIDEELETVERYFNDRLRTKAPEEPTKQKARDYFKEVFNGRDFKRDRRDRHSRRFRR